MSQYFKHPKRYLCGYLLLGVQIFMIINARFNENRYFCWAPHDQQSAYTLKVSVDGQILNSQEIFDRYRITQKGRDPRAIQHIKNILAQYESTYGKDQIANIKMNYRVNGVPQIPWHWPPENSK